MDLAGDPVSRVLAQLVADHPAAHVIDIGGGSGTRAVPLAEAGCTVLVVDVSTDALASLALRAAEAGVADRIEAIQADADHLDQLLPTRSADVVLFHHVAADVEDPVGSLRAAGELLRPTGHLSVLVESRLAVVAQRVMAGDFDAALELLSDQRPLAGCYDADQLRALVAQSGLVTESLTGIGVVATLTGQSRREHELAQLAPLSQLLGSHPILGQLAGELHAVAMRPAP